LMLWFAFARPK